MIPSLLKSWTVSANNEVTASNYIDMDRSVLLFIKNSMLTLVSGAAWTVVGSSDGTTASMIDGVDRWTSTSKINWSWSPNPFSWIILQQSAIAPNFQVLFSCYHNSEGRFRIYIAPGGFVSGTTTVEPTAVDKVAIPTETTWSEYPFGIDNQTITVNSAMVPAYMNAFFSNDGTVTRFTCCYNGSYKGMMGFEKPINAPVEWTSASFAYCDWAGRSYWNAYYNFDWYDRQGYKGYISGSSVVFDLVSEATSQGGPSNFVNRMMLTTVDKLSNEFPFYPLGLYCNTSGRYGYQGDFVDLWHITNYFVTEVAVFPSDGSRQFVKMGAYILPWDGSSIPKTRS